MGESSDAEPASLRRSVVSLTNGPSIMILGRLVSSRPGSPEPDPIRIARETRSLCMITLASTLGIYPGTSYLPAPADPPRDRGREAVGRGSTQGNVMLSWGEAESPLPGQVYVTPQATCG
jgi:hypothetical protein